MNKDISLKELKLSEEKKKQGVYNENQLKKLKFQKIHEDVRNKYDVISRYCKKKRNNSLLKEDEEYVKILEK